jgi:enterobactin synthetase component D
MEQDLNALLVKVPSLATLCGPPAHRSSVADTQSSSVELPSLDADLSALDARTLVPDSIRHAVRKPQIEWIGGRLCAESALRLLGPPFHAVPRGPRGEPLWPQGVAGSITHEESSAHALVMRRSDGAGIGIDSERIVDPQAQQAVAAICCNANERATWLQGPDALVRTTLLFAAKEAFYKAAWPALRRFIEFDEVEVHASNVPDGTIVLRTSTTLPDAQLQAIFRIDEARSTVHVCIHLDASFVHRLTQARDRSPGAGMNLPSHQHRSLQRRHGANAILTGPSTFMEQQGRQSW